MEGGNTKESLERKNIMENSMREKGEESHVLKKEIGRNCFKLYRKNEERRDRLDDKMNVLDSEPKGHKNPLSLAYSSADNGGGGWMGTMGGTGVGARG